MNYNEFLHSKIQVAPVSGFEVRSEEVHPALKPHQRDAVIWACKGGRRALFESFGLGTVAMMALRMKRKGYTIELNPDYFRDAVGYLRAEEVEVEQPSLFDLLEQEA